MSRAVDDFDYIFPPDLIAQRPSARREEARLLCVTRGAAEAGRPVVSADSTIAALPAHLSAGDLLVLNEARVAPARLSARRRSGGRVGVLVLAASGRSAQVLLGARGTPAPGEDLLLDGAVWRLSASHGEGRYAIEVLEGPDVERTMADQGRMPLPPYIRRGPERDERDALDRERYQTTYAAGPPRAVAAPTAGLHLTPVLLQRLADAGIRYVTLRLDVGEGTFRPLRGPTIDDHVMHSESFDIPPATAEAIATTRAAGGRIVAVGTTVVRALESATRPDGTITAGAATTGVFLRPGHRFRAVDALLTNFHQPRSTLLVLVSAFAGRQTIRAAYRHAVAARYRLFSYGDAMLLAGGEAPASGPPPGTA